MRKLVLLSALLVSFSLISCVSTSTYDAMVFTKDSLQVFHDSLELVIQEKNKDISQLQLETSVMTETIRELRSKLESTNDNYRRLKEKTSTDTQDLMSKIESLQSDLFDKRKEIIELQSKVEAYEEKLKSRDEAMQKLKNRLQDALLGFQEMGMTVAIKDGKVYVSLSNQLLFSSGSTDIDATGKEALLELSKVLNEQTDINILVEGHTDNQAVRPGAKFKDNWDLSVLRSTEVVRFLIEQGSVSPLRVTASGRGEYFPIEKGETTEARATNRRTEIILTPKMQELFEIIND